MEKLEDVIIGLKGDQGRVEGQGAFHDFPQVRLRHILAEERACDRDSNFLESQFAEFVPETGPEDRQFVRHVEAVVRGKRAQDGFLEIDLVLRIVGGVVAHGRKWFGRWREPTQADNVSPNNSKIFFPRHRHPVLVENGNNQKAIAKIGPVDNGKRETDQVIVAVAFRGGCGVRNRCFILRSVSKGHPWLFCRQQLGFHPNGTLRAWRRTHHSTPEGDQVRQE